jgi:hypothetical protein
VGLGVILTYNSNPDQGLAVADKINDDGGKAVALQLDSAKTSSFNDFISQVAKFRPCSEQVPSKNNKSLSLRDITPPLPHRFFLKQGG